MLKNLTKTSIISTVMIAGACSHGISQEPWSYKMNPIGRRFLSASSTVSTPDGAKKCNVIFSHPVGQPNTIYLEFQVSGASRVTHFHFDAFDGPDATASGNLMTITFKSEHDSKSHSFCPNGGYVVDPEDGFSFQTFEEGAKNPLLKLIKMATEGHGTFIIKVKDPKDSKIELSASFPVEEKTSSFHQFVH